MIGSLSLSHKIVGFFVLFSGFFMVSGIVSNGKVYADCGANGATIHGYAGAVIDVRIRSSTGVVREAPRSTPVYIRAVNPSTPAGNIYDLDSGRRFIAGNFTQIDNSCAGNQGSHSAVFGYGRTSQPTGGPIGEWALDCDRSVRGTSNQPFTATGQGTPSGARALYGAYINNPSYGWTVAPINPTNGTTQYTFITYREPPPPPAQPNTGTINFLDCRNFTSLGLQRNTSLAIRYILLKRDLAGSPSVVVANTSRADSVDSFPVSLGGAGPYYLELQVLDTTVATPTWRIVDTAVNQSLPCTGPAQPIRPTFNLEATCQGVWVRNLVDRDNPNAGVRIYGEIKHRYTSGGVSASAPIQNFDLDNQRGDVLIPWPWAADDNVNQGWRLELNVYDTNPRGDKINPQYIGPVDLIDTTCYSATCTLISVSPSVHPSRPTGVQAGSAFTATVRLTNTGRLPIPANSFRAAYDYPAGNRVTHPTTPIGPIPAPANPAAPTAANMATATISVTAPNSISSWGVYPYLFDKYALGGICGSIDTYLPFQIVPNADAVQLGPDPESPTRIAFSSNASKTPDGGSGSVPGITINRSILRKDNGSVVANFNPAVNQSLNTDGMAFGPTRPAPWQDTYTGPIDPALEYCGRITVSPAAGWHGPGGDIIATDPDESDSTEDCVSRLDKPYVKTFGGDVVAGAVFPGADGSCDVSLNSDIKANMRPFAEGKKGAGTQLAAMAPGSVNGFFSASLRGAAPIAPAGLTTISGATGGGDLLSPYWGGNYEANKCLKDYFTTQRVASDSDDLQSTGSMNNNSLDLNILETNKQTLFSGGNVTTAGAVDLGNKRHSMFVDGDVYITGNITSNTTFNGNPANVGSFRMFVRGNIYIDRAVSQLDGMFVAQPIADGSKGKIFTCTSGMGAPISNSNQRFTDCGTQLTVFGSFVANEVILGRIGPSIRDSLTQEDFVGTNKSRAAEVFVFTPEVYHANSATRPTSRPTSGDYQYIATLPPIL